MGAILLLLVGVAVKGASPPPMPPTPPKDFAFVLGFGMESKDRIDTFKGQVTKDRVSAPSATAKFVLPAADRLKIYRKMAEINIFSYPDDFSPHQVGNLRELVSPHPSYELTIRCGGRVKRFQWEDTSDGSGHYDRKSEQMYELLRLMTTTTRSLREYQRLPSPEGGYL